MNKNLFIAVALTAVLALAGTCWARPDYSNVGRSGLTFLKIGVGSRAIGMSGAYTAVANDVSAIYWNPAGVAKIKKVEAIFCHTNWIYDVNHEFVGVVIPGGLMGNFGISASIVTMGDFERTTIDDITTNGVSEDDGKGLTPFSSNDISLGLTYAVNMTDKFSVGVTGKYVREKIDNETAGGMAFDVGTYYLTGYKTLRIGMAILNYGPDIAFSGKDLQADIKDNSWPANFTGNSWEIITTSFSLPMQFKIGAAYDFLFGKNNILTTSGELIHPSDGSEKVALGAEYMLKRSLVNFSLRGGYILDPDWYETKSAMDNVSAGAGLTRKIGSSTISVDYSFTNKGYLSNMHRISLGLGL
jgi:hypothetical protein